MFRYDNKQIILLMSIRNNSPDLQCTVKKKVANDNTIWEKESLITADNTGQAQ